MTIPIFAQPADSIEERNRLFDQLVTPRIDTLRNIVAAQTFPGEDPDDNLQDVLTHLLMAITSYDPAMAPFSVWLNTVVANRMLLIHRRDTTAARYWADTPALHPDDVLPTSTDDSPATVPQALCIDPSDALRRPLRAEPSPTLHLPAPPLTVQPDDYPTTYAALDGLTALQRRALLLAAEGWKIADIADELGTTPPDASALLYRARVKMKRALAAAEKPQPKTRKAQAG